MDGSCPFEWCGSGNRPRRARPEGWRLGGVRRRRGRRVSSAHLARGRVPGAAPRKFGIGPVHAADAFQLAGFEPEPRFAASAAVRPEQEAAKFVRRSSCDLYQHAAESFIGEGADLGDVAGGEIGVLGGLGLAAGAQLGRFALEKGAEGGGFCGCEHRCTHRRVFAPATAWRVRSPAKSRPLCSAAGGGVVGAVRWPRLCRRNCCSAFLVWVKWMPARRESATYTN